MPAVRPLHGATEESKQQTGSRQPRAREFQNAFLEFLPTVGLAMVVNLRRGYPDTVLAEKFLMHCWEPFSLHHLVFQLWYHQVIQERGLSALTNKYKQQIE